MSKKQLGGLKLKLKKSPDLDEKFAPVFDMILEPSSTINLLTASSLVGFMFTLNVPNNPRYNDLRYKQQKSVTSYILKFAIITSSGRPLISSYIEVNRDGTNKISPSGNIMDVNKESETERSFFDEAKTQQNIWFKTITTATEISPSVANLSFLNNDNALLLLEYILHNKPIRADTKHAIIYLIGELKNNKLDATLGVLTMKNYEGSMTLGDYLNSLDPNSDANKIKHILQCVIVKIIRLFYVGYIHFDLHDGNILVINPTSATPDCVIIDFGQVSNFENGTNDYYLDTTQKNAFKTLKNDLFNRRLLVQIHDKNKSSVSIEEVMDKIDVADHKNNSDNNGKDHSQMDYWKTMLAYDTTPFIQQIYSNANALDTQVYNEIIISNNNPLTGSTLSGYRSSGELFNDLFAGNVNNNYMDNNFVNRIPRVASSIAAVPGPRQSFCDKFTCLFKWNGGKTRKLYRQVNKQKLNKHKRKSHKRKSHKRKSHKRKL